MLGDDEEEEHATVSVTANGEDDTDSLEWCIREMLKDEFGHVQPRPFQISAIATLVRRSGQTNPSLLLVQKTGHGKSLVPLGALMMLGGVAIVVVPFHAIGTGQASSSTSVSEYLECGVLSGTNFVRRREKNCGHASLAAQAERRIDAL
jgi:superfamily II DNA or RNA helicase